jgi:hypothetical protein
MKIRFRMLCYWIYPIQYVISTLCIGRARDKEKIETRVTMAVKKCNTYPVCARRHAEPRRHRRRFPLKHTRNSVHEGVITARSVPRRSVIHCIDLRKVTVRILLLCVFLGGHHAVLRHSQPSLCQDAWLPASGCCPNGSVCYEVVRRPRQGTRPCRELQHP